MNADLISSRNLLRLWKTGCSKRTGAPRSAAEQFSTLRGGQLAISHRTRVERARGSGGYPPLHVLFHTTGEALALALDTRRPARDAGQARWPSSKPPLAEIKWTPLPLAEKRIGGTRGEHAADQEGRRCVKRWHPEKNGGWIGMAIYAQSERRLRAGSYRRDDPHAAPSGCGLARLQRRAAARRTRGVEPADQNVAVTDRMSCRAEGQ